MARSHLRVVLWALLAGGTALPGPAGAVLVEIQLKADPTKCVRLAEDSLADGTLLTVGDCATTATDLKTWLFDEGNQRVRAVRDSTKCWKIRGDLATVPDHNPVEIRPCAGGDALKQWTFTSKSHLIKPIADGSKCLQRASAKHPDAELRPCKTGRAKNKRWNLVPVANYGTYYDTTRPSWCPQLLFVSAGQSTNETDFYVLGSGDFDADGRRDVVAGNLSSPGAQVEVHNGDGRGRLIPGGPTITGIFGVTTLAVGDFNQDGMSDIVLASQVPQAVSHFFGDGRNGFTGPTNQWALVGLGYKMTAGDVNGDGIADRAWTDGTSSYIQGIIGTPGGGGSQSVFASYFNGFWNADFVDYNHDGLSDLIYSTRFYEFSTPGIQQYPMAVVPGSEAGLDGAKRIYPLFVGNFRYPDSVTSSDMTGDGLSDLVAFSAPDARVGVIPALSPGTYRSVPWDPNLVREHPDTIALDTGCNFDIGPVTERQAFLVADFNNDGVDDIVVGRGRNIEVLLNFSP